MIWKQLKQKKAGAANEQESLSGAPVVDDDDNEVCSSAWRPFRYAASPSPPNDNYFTRVKQPNESSTLASLIEMIT